MTAKIIPIDGARLAFLDGLKRQQATSGQPEAEKKKATPRVDPTPRPTER